MKRSFKYILGFVVTAAVGAQAATALTVTQTGAFSSDNQVVEYDFTLPSSTTVALYTTSYAGGVNADGTTTAAGGFVPDLTLFQSNGSVITSDGATGTSRGSLQADPVTGLYNDAYISTNLAAGNYILTLSEFPNVAVGNFSDGFLLSSPTATGDTCSVSGGKFLEADVAPCVQRTGNYALNVSTTPEPATLWLIVPTIAAAFLWRKRQSILS